MNKYLITGGSGFIGTNLVKYIRHVDPSAKITVVTYVEPIYPAENCKYIVCSVANTEKYERYIDGNTVVIHLAWSGFPNIKISNAFEGIENNVVNSCRLFEAAINHNSRCIVYLSSGGGIYGKPMTVPIRESHPTTPLSYYGVEKLAVENYLRLMTINTSTSAVILRPGNPYGRYQRPFTGQGVVATFLASAILDKPVEVWGDGSAVRDYFYIDDLSAAIYKSTLVKDKCVIANVGSGQGSSINDIISAINTASGKKLQVKYLPVMNSETGANILDCSVAKESIMWEPKYSLDQGIKIMLSTWNPKTEQFDEGNI